MGLGGGEGTRLRGKEPYVKMTREPISLEEPKQPKITTSMVEEGESLRR